MQLVLNFIYEKVNIHLNSLLYNIKETDTTSQKRAIIILNALRISYLK